MLFEVVLVLLTGVLWWAWKQTSRFNRMVAKFPGPRSYPLVGNVLQMGSNPIEVMEFAIRTSKRYSGKPFVIWVSGIAFIVLTQPQDIETILESNKLLDKGSIYDFIQRWLGTGLLTSQGAKWRKHRKILTPTFHFKILEEFLEVINANSAIMVDKMKKETDGPGFDIHQKYIKLCTLDIISESAMGVNINAQTNSDGIYVKAVRDLSIIFVLKSFHPWLQIDFLFNLTRTKAKEDAALEVVHKTTNSIIKSRKEEITKERATRDVITNEEDINQSDGVKKRLALLDMLIESTFNGSQLSDEDIRDEVNTFMFAGHDTTSSALSFCIWLLSWHQDVQDSVFQEIQEVFPDPDEPLAYRGLHDLKYLERVIKETLRLYPSVPLIVRLLNEDLKLPSGLIAPKGSNVVISAYSVHRNPVIFPDPERFDPDRFLPDNVHGRHPYAYLPFSAGPRNCIGHKFAMLEMKAAITHVLRSYKLVPGTDKPNIVLYPVIVLTSITGFTVKIISRK